MPLEHSLGLSSVFSPLLNVLILVSLFANSGPKFEFSNSKLNYIMFKHLAGELNA